MLTELSTTECRKISTRERTALSSNDLRYLPGTTTTTASRGRRRRYICRGAGDGDGDGGGTGYVSAARRAVEGELPTTNYSSAVRVRHASPQGGGIRVLHDTGVPHSAHSHPFLRAASRGGGGAAQGGRPFTRGPKRTYSEKTANHRQCAPPAVEICKDDTDRW